MKSHTVKSNAKRAARKLCEDFPAFMPATPVEAAEGEWFPAVLPVEPGTAVPDEVSAVAVVRGVTVAPVNAADAGPYAAPFEDMGEVAEAEARAFTLKPAPAVDYKGTVAAARAGKGAKGEAVKLAPEQLAKALADLPPPVASSAEDIAARRAARRDRLDAEKASPKPAPEPKAKPETRAKIIMRMVSAEGGSTIEAIMAACDWQRHTLRGYIGGTLRKRLAGEQKTIATVRKSGEPTRYVLADLPKAS